MKKERKIAVLSAVALLAALCFGIPQGMAANVVELKVASFDPGEHPANHARLHYFAEVEKRTGGKVKIKWYPGGSLVKANQTYDALKSGLIDVAAPLGIWAFENLFPVSRILTLPFMSDSAPHGSLVFRKAFENIPEIRKEFADLKILYFQTTGLGSFSTFRPAIKTQEDFKNLKIYAGSAVGIEMVRALGGVAVSLKIEDLYMSLQRKALDGVAFPIAPLYAFKLTDLLNNHCVHMGGVGKVPLAMRLSTWNSLPPDVQKVFDDLSLSAGCFGASTAEALEKWILGKMKERGDDVYYLPDQEKERWKKAMQPLYDKWIGEANAKGVNGKAIYEKVLAIAQETRGTPCKREDWWKRELVER